MTARCALTELRNSRDCCKESKQPSRTWRFPLQATPSSDLQTKQRFFFCLDLHIVLAKSFQLRRKIFGIQAEHNRYTLARQKPAAREGDPQLAGSTPSLFQGQKGAALESGPGSLGQAWTGAPRDRAGQCCPSEATCVAESPRLTAAAFHTHRSAVEAQLRHSGWVSEDKGGFQSRALPFQHSSCALPASVCLHGMPRPSPPACAACSGSRSGSVPGLRLSAAPGPG